MSVTRRVELDFDGDVRTMVVEGDVGFGGDEILLDRDDDLTIGTSWSDVGYTVEPFLAGRLHQQLAAGLTELVRSLVAESGATGLDSFRLDRYHRFVDDAGHQRVIKRAQDCFTADELPIDIAAIVERVSAVCGVSVTARCPDQPEQKPGEGRGGGCRDGFCIRIVRPGAVGDNNPPHRDVWLSHLRNALNLYVPLCGSNHLSALTLVPGSHRWRESEIERTIGGAVVDGRAFTVRGVTGATRPMRFTRPNPRPDEMLLFSPYLIHGGATNLNSDITRVSLEMRFWRSRPHG